jgi:hypothetical protein
MSGNGGAGLTEELLSWAGVTVHPHRLGGVEFHLNAHAIEITRSKHDQVILRRM